MLFAIVFGLSMDYEVFLVSRIHEQWAQRRRPPRRQRRAGAHRARVTAAAAIMICVFLSFMLGESSVIKEFGLSLARRCSSTRWWCAACCSPPCCILGNITWSIPAWLDRLLPRLNIEGSSTRLPAEEKELASLATEQRIPAGTRGGTDD